MCVTNEVWSMTGKDCEKTAVSLLIEENQLDRHDTRCRRMLHEANELKEEIIDHVVVRAVYHYYGDIDIRGPELVIHGKRFESQALNGVDPAQILGAYVFVLTAGDFSAQDRPVKEQILLDLWGTAFATAGRRHLQAYFAKEGRTSEIFGPGLYGIPLETMHGLVSLVEAERIGVTVNESCFLQPVKSCGGIIFRVTDGYKPCGGPCAACRGSGLSCSLCDFKPGEGTK